jgi:K+/H+ antiporter YhaU regulatory subunit KhtT
MTREANIQNLLKIGAVKTTPRDACVIHQRLADAEAYLTDTRNATTTQARFLLAVEGVRQVSLAVLNHTGIKVNPTAQHKIDVPQLAAMITQLDTVAPGAAKSLGEMRNIRIQRKSVSPAPPITPEWAAHAVQIFEQLLARAQILTSGSENS